MVTTLRSRPVAGSLDEMLAGAGRRTPFAAADGKSGSNFERVEIDGRRYVLKVMHVDGDWIARSLGDLGCHPVTVWAAGLLDVLPDAIDHTVVAAARGFGRNGWGAALLMHDVGQHLVPEGDTRVPRAQHAAFIEHLAALSARLWGWTDTVGLLPPATRWSFFGPDMLAVERARGFPDPVPAIAHRGWQRWEERAPADVRDTVAGLRRAPWVLADALAATPSTFIHGDWKMGNLGSHPDGRTILLDCAYPGAGPACHDLGWYLALNQARLPEPKDAAITRFRDALVRHGVDVAGWWDRQLDLCLLGTVVQFGWEKALGDDAELGWWTDRARAGAAWL
ncbi:MAG TPA: hypothetical protein VFI47_01635 [Acidimicrobiales bacterium]|nr:hypothetical protein [Acidimicrobiales bacterium]